MLARALNSDIRIWDQPSGADFANLIKKTAPASCLPFDRGLEAAIDSHGEAGNANPKRLAWTKSADDVLAPFKRFSLAP